MSQPGPHPDPASAPSRDLPPPDRVVGSMQLTHRDDTARQADAALRRQNAYLAALHETMLALLGQRDPDELLRAIVARAAALAETPHGYLYLVREAEDALELVVGLGNSAPYVGYRMARGESVAGRVWASGLTLAVTDYRSWRGRPRRIARATYRAVAGVPLIVGGAVAGVIGLAYTEAGRRFDAEQLAALGQFAQLAALALDNARLHEARRASEERLRAVIAHMPVILYTLDRAGVATLSEGRGLAALGLQPNEAVGQSMFERYRDVPQVTDIIRRALAGDTVSAVTEVGGVVFENWMGPLRDGDGEVAGAIGVAVDVTERARAQEALAASERRFRALVQRASDLVAILDADGTVRYVSPAVERILGYAPAEVVGGKRLGWVHPDDAEQAQRVLGEIGDAPDRAATHEFRLRHKDGSWRWVECVCTNLFDEPSVGGLVVNARDITERKALEAQLTHRALHDPLTGLPNRELFVDRLAQALAAAERHRERVAVLFVDLDRFKVVNDSLGHYAGDQLLATVAERLRACVRPGDTVSRLGGDEFTVLLTGLGDAGEATAVAGRILDELRTPCVLDGETVHVTASVGVTLSATGDDEPAELLRHADAAMYRAKRQGKARYAVFEPGMAIRAGERLRLEDELRHALARGELTLRYQPQIELASGRVLGLEALLRWRHPRRGLLPPAEFVPLAEETGLIGPLGHWVLEEACRQAAWWQARYPGTPPLTLGVNLSAMQVQEPALVAEVAQTLRVTGVDPRSVELELTEGTVMEGTPPVLGVLRGLKGLGVRLAIDDFGAGHASFGYVKLFPVDTLKIDKSYVAGLERSGEDAAIVRAMVAMARTLGMRVTAEGVERAGQLRQLQTLGCEVGQGYHFAEPLVRQAVDELLKQVPR